MTQISILEASQLTGKSVKTIYRHISQGKVSVILNQDNVRMIDLSELSRVYQIKTPVKDNNENLNVVSMSLDEIPYLRKELALSHEIADNLKLLLIEKDKRIELLTYSLPTKDSPQAVQNTQDAYIWVYFLLAIAITAIGVSLFWLTYF